MDKGMLRQSGRIRVPRPVLALAAVLLLALGAAALASAHGSATHGSAPLGGQWFLFAVTAAILGCVAVFKLRARISDAEPASTARGRLDRGVLAVVAVLTAAVPIALFVMRAQQPSAQTACVTGCINILPTGATKGQNPPPPPSGNANAHHDGLKLPLSLILLILGIVLAILVAAIVIVLVVKLRGLAKAGAGITATPPPALAEEAEDESALGAAVLAGRNALEGEARAAIIACYAAMEESLTQAGVPRLASDSPADLLARATQRGVVDGPAPRLLAKLFREARFSTHPMNAQHLDQARDALDAIVEQLGMVAQ